MKYPAIATTTITIKTASIVRPTISPTLLRPFFDGPVVGPAWPVEDGVIDGPLPVDVVTEGE